MSLSSLAHWHRTLAATTGILVAAGLLTACTSDNNDDEPTQTELEQSVEPTESDSAGEVQRDDLIDEHSVEWLNAEPVSETEIQVTAMIGTERCFGARAVVEETEDEIQLAVIEGTLPDAPDACTMELREVSLLVPLETPVHDRDIVPLEDPQLN